jgi:hypothetical protein
LQKLKLKSFQIAGNKQGNIVIEIYNLKDEVISAVPVKVNKEKNIQTVNLDTYLQTGSYYITFKGDCDLWRNDSCSNYPYEIRKVINIKGNSSSSNFYYYFYNWELSF